LDQAVRVLQAIVDVCSEAGWIDSTLKAMQLCQMVTQGRWHDDSTLLNLPHCGAPNKPLLKLLWEAGVETLADLLVVPTAQLDQLVSRAGLSSRRAEDFYKAVTQLPLVDFAVAVVKLESSRENAVNNNGSSNNSSSARAPVFAPYEEVTVSVQVLRQQAVCVTGSKGGNSSNANSRATSAASDKAFAPKFPKPKIEGWWLVVGHYAHTGGPTGAAAGAPAAGAGELVAVKRCFIRAGARQSHALSFEAADAPGVYTLRVLLVSDSYIGLDQVKHVWFLE
jgi:hypothetical protein